jgi:hypothetical protein
VTGLTYDEAGTSESRNAQTSGAAMGMKAAPAAELWREVMGGATRACAVLDGGSSN